jgi:hypothetical protein
MIGKQRNVVLSTWPRDLAKEVMKIVLQTMWLGKWVLKNV